MGLDGVEALAHGDHREVRATGAGPPLCGLDLSSRLLDPLVMRSAPKSPTLRPAAASWADPVPPGQAMVEDPANTKPSPSGRPGGTPAGRSHPPRSGSAGRARDDAPGRRGRRSRRSSAVRSQPPQLADLLLVPGAPRGGSPGPGRRTPRSSSPCRRRAAAGHPKQVEVGGLSGDEHRLALRQDQHAGTSSSRAVMPATYANITNGSWNGCPSV